MKSEDQLRRDVQIDQMEANLLDNFKETFKECETVIHNPTKPIILSENMSRLIAYGLSKLSQLRDI